MEACRWFLSSSSPCSGSPGCHCYWMSVSLLIYDAWTTLHLCDVYLFKKQTVSIHGKVINGSGTPDFVLGHVQWRRILFCLQNYITSTLFWKSLIFFFVFVFSYCTDNMPENTRQDSGVLCCCVGAERHWQGNNVGNSSFEWVKGIMHTAYGRWI